MPLLAGRGTMQMGVLQHPAGGGTVSADIERKLKRYRQFWEGSPMDRPIIGFSLGGWFPLHHYSALQKLRNQGNMAPDQFDPEEFFGDYDRIVAQYENVNDDVIRAVAPLPPFPWLEAMLGCSVRIGDESIWVEEGGFEYGALAELDLSANNAWRKKYLHFVSALRDRYRDRCPVGQPILRGVSDMIAALRGTAQMVLDLYDWPEQYRRLARLCSNLLLDLIREQHVVTGPFQGGYEIEQFSLWAPGHTIRIQEDASALLSPDLYTRYLQEENRRLAQAFPYNLIHLHASSLFLLEQILEIKELLCIQINKDVGGSTIEKELPYFERVQAEDRRLLIRGKLDRDDLELLRRKLSPRGLYLQIVVETFEETQSLHDVLAPWA
jgi:hypothetical protein